MSEIKRQHLPGGLWVVATPIGNLADITERARQALEEADWIVCEDTRRTAQLLTALGIGRGRARLERLDAHADARRITEFTERLRAGETVALVTDAGTPAISDPGSALVDSAHRAGVRVVPIPGASAVVALLSVAGFLRTTFTFRGFFPRKTKEREAELRSLVGHVGVWFESPERVGDALEDLARVRPDVQVVVAKELTKLHERVFRGTAAEVSAAVAGLPPEQARGEWCFAVDLGPASEPSLSKEDQGGSSEGAAAAGSGGSEADSSEWVKALLCLLEAQVSASVAAKQVSQHFGVQRRTVYERALLLSGKKFSKGG